MTLKKRSHAFNSFIHLETKEPNFTLYSIIILTSSFHVTFIWIHKLDSVLVWGKKQTLMWDSEFLEPAMILFRLSLGCYVHLTSTAADGISHQQADHAQLKASKSTHAPHVRASSAVKTYREGTVRGRTIKNNETLCGISAWRWRRQPTAADMCVSHPSPCRKSVK